MEKSDRERETLAHKLGGWPRKAQDYRYRVWQSGARDTSVGSGASESSHCASDVLPSSLARSHPMRDKESIPKINSLVQICCSLHMWIYVFSWVIPNSNAFVANWSGMKVLQEVVDQSKTTWEGDGKCDYGVIPCGDLCWRVMSVRWVQCKGQYSSGI